jgi:predicted PurR-regulated permease PerM
MDNIPEGLDSARPAAFARGTAALRVLAAGVLGALFYFAHAALVPIVLALLFSLILSKPVEALHRRGLPRSSAAILVLVILLTIAGTTVNLLWTPAQTWWASAPQTILTIEKKIRPASRLVNRVEMLTERAGQITQTPGAAAQKPSAGAAENSAAPAAPAAQPPANVAVVVLDEMRSVLISSVTVIIVTLFSLAGGPPMLARMTATLSEDLNSSHTLKVIDAVRGEVSRYYVSIALINAGLGVATTAVTMLLGMPNPLLWGAVAAILNFVPYVGPATTLILLSIVALVTFDNVGHVFAVAGSFLALSTIEGQVVQPLVVGQRLKLNPLIVFLALWFWGWFWGIPGIIIAVPSLVALKVVAEHSRNGKPLQEFLSPNQSSYLSPAQVAKSLALRPIRKKAGG